MSNGKPDWTRKGLSLPLEDYPGSFAGKERVIGCLVKDAVRCGVNEFSIHLKPPYAWWNELPKED